MRWTRRIGVVAGASAVALLWRRHGLRRFEIVERSMEPTLRSGDYVIAMRTSGTPERGAIVVFRPPGRPGFDVVKRVVGLPGESIEIGNGSVHTDRRVLAEPWADGPTYPDGSWDLRPDEVFVLGDRRAASSRDSRQIGAVSTGTTKWRVTWRYWPPGRIGRVR